MAVTLFLYFHGLKNEMEGAFAYGQGNEETMTHSVAAVVRDPMKGVKFLVSLLGANFARGIFGTRHILALWFGWLVVTLFADLLLIVWLRRKIGSFRVAVLPFVIIGLYGLAVAGMVAAGRAWASKEVACASVTCPERADIPRRAANGATKYQRPLREPPHPPAGPE